MVWGLTLNSADKFVWSEPASSCCIFTPSPNHPASPRRKEREGERETTSSSLLTQIESPTQIVPRSHCVIDPVRLAFGSSVLCCSVHLPCAKRWRWMRSPLDEWEREGRELGAERESVR